MNISQKIAALVLLVANDTAQATVTAHKDSAAAKVRELVTEAHEAGMDVEKVAEAFAAGCKAVKKESRGKAYKKAMLGYGLALDNGQSIETGFGKGEVKDKPMPIKVAQDLHTAATASDEEKARQAVVTLLRERIGPWLKDGTVAELSKILESLPVKEGAVKTVQAEVPAQDAVNAAVAAYGLDESDESESEADEGKGIAQAA